LMIDDDLFPIYTKMKEAEAIILATPVYFGSATALLKALMDRAGYLAYNNGRVFDGKVGGPLVVARRAGQNFTLAQLMYWFHIQGFFMPGSTYWNIAFGQKRGDVVSDKEGFTTAWNFGKMELWQENRLTGQKTEYLAISIFCISQFVSKINISLHLVFFLLLFSLRCL